MENSPGSLFGLGWVKSSSEEAGWIPKAAQHTLLMGAKGQLVPNSPQKNMSRDE